MIQSLRLGSVYQAMVDIKKDGVVIVPREDKFVCEESEFRGLTSMITIVTMDGVRHEFKRHLINTDLSLGLIVELR